MAKKRNPKRVRNEQPVHGEIRVERLVIVDGNGDTAAVLQGAPNGGAELALLYPGDDYTMVSIATGVDRDCDASDHVARANIVILDDGVWHELNARTLSTPLR